MSWVLVIVAGLFETMFAVALKQSNGFRHPLPTAVFIVSAVVSFLLLNQALKDLPVGTAYAVWTGIGGAGTAVVGMLWLGDAATTLRVMSIVLIVAGVVGLNLATGGAAH